MKLVFCIEIFIIYFLLILFIFSAILLYYQNLCNNLYNIPITDLYNIVKFDSPAVSAIAEFKERWSVIGWVTKNLFRASEGTLSRWSRLHLQWLVRTESARWVMARSFYV
jgi:hypothetical protein